MLTTLALGCATGPSGKVFDSPIGAWTENYESSTGVGGVTKTSKFIIIDDTRGTYTHPSGRVEFYAIDEPRRWRGYWINESGEKSFLCSAEKSGSPYWGEMIYQFNASYNQYTGSWDKCGKGKKYAIKGFR